MYLALAMCFLVSIFISVVCAVAVMNEKIKRDKAEILAEFKSLCTVMHNCITGMQTHKDKKQQANIKEDFECYGDLN